VHKVTDEKTGKSELVRAVKVFDHDGFATVTETPAGSQAREGMSFSFKPANPEQSRQYDSKVADLVAYLVFMTDPSRASRVQIGVWVLLFLAVFTVLAWWLNRAFWKDVK
jgi:ubiquinol-cytochrome c reductase cytochrome c1 subunit